MKKFFTLLTSLCLCATVFAAGRGSLVNVSNVFGDRLLETISDDSEGTTATLEYNIKLQLYRVTSHVNWGGTTWYETTDFDYTGGTVNGKDYDVKIVTTDSEETTTMYITVGDNLFASSVYEVTSSDYDGESTATWSFEYNADGQLVKMVRSESDNEVTTITYSDGDIVKVDVDNDDNDHDSTTLSYVDAPENTSGIMLFDTAFGIDMDEMGIAYFAGLLGKPTKHLPTSSVDSEGYTENYIWIDLTDYSSILVIESGDDTETYRFGWIEFSGIKDVNNGSAHAVEYYNLQGVRITAPTHGLYIVKNSDGSTSKIILN